MTDWKNLADLRLRGSVPLPWDLNASFIYRNTPGAPQDATLAGDSRRTGRAFKDPDAHRADHRADA